MANIKSQIKRNRQNDKRRLRNRVYRGQARLAIKEARTAMDATAPESREQILKAISALDRAAERGVIHKNNAARRKSRLMKALAKMGPVKMVEAAPAVVEPAVEVEEPRKPAPRKRAAAKAETKEEAKKTESGKPAAAKGRKSSAKKPATKKTPSRSKTAAKK